MTINDPEKFCASLWDWGVLRGCFGDTKIEPTDIDGMVERHGQFLWFETKEPNVRIPDGQRITFTNAASTNFITVLVIWGHPGEPQKMHSWWRDREKTYENTSLDRLREFVSNWYDWADTQNGHHNK